jgi:hypothetical protein
MSAVCVFCGSSPGLRPAYRGAAGELGRRLGADGHTLVYGGAQIGLMGAVADGALAAGGEVVGVVPTVIDLPEITHDRLTRLHRVGTMHQRKAMMAELSDAFVALPGGIGTLDELAEILCWAQLGVHRKPVWLLDIAGYYRPLVAFLAHAVAEGFMREEHLALMRVAESVDEVEI